MKTPSPRSRVAIVEDGINVGGLLEEVGDPGAGAVALFLGTVRNHSPRREGVTHLEYEVYRTQVCAKITEIVSEASRRWSVVAIAVEHRMGKVEVGEVAVAVAVSSGHRAEAFAAARYLIDELKERAPIWKKEHWSGGSEWSRGS